MLGAEATQIIEWFIAAYPTERIEPGTVKLWGERLMELDAKIASEAALTYIKERRRFPTVAEFDEIYRGIRQRQRRESAAKHGLPEPTEKEKPLWVIRHERARKAGDERLFPEQIQGIRTLHFTGGSPPGGDEKYPGYPSGYERDMEIIARTTIDDPAYWVQPEEYLEAVT